MLVNVVNDRVSQTGPGRALPRGRLSPLALTPAASGCPDADGNRLEVVRPSARTSSGLEPHGRQDGCRLGVTMALLFGVQRPGRGLGHTALLNPAFVLGEATTHGQCA